MVNGFKPMIISKSQRVTLNTLEKSPHGDNRTICQKINENIVSNTDCRSYYCNAGESPASATRYQKLLVEANFADCKNLLRLVSSNRISEERRLSQKDKTHAIENSRTHAIANAYAHAKTAGLQHGRFADVCAEPCGSISEYRCGGLGGYRENWRCVWCLSFPKGSSKIESMRMSTRVGLSGKGNLPRSVSMLSESAWNYNESAPFTGSLCRGLPNIEVISHILANEPLNQPAEPINQPAARPTV